MFRGEEIAPPGGCLVKYELMCVKLNFVVVAQLEQNFDCVNAFGDCIGTH